MEGKIIRGEENNTFLRNSFMFLLAYRSITPMFILHFSFKFYKFLLFIIYLQIILVFPYLYNMVLVPTISDNRESTVYPNLKFEDVS